MGTSTPKPTKRSRKGIGGRPSKYNPERVAIICDALERGRYPDTAAALAGICVDSFYAWQKEHPEFSDAVKMAILRGEHQTLSDLEAAPPGEWQKHAWKLERRYRDKWGRFDKHEITGKGGGPLKVVVTYDEEYKAPNGADTSTEAA